MAGRAGWACYRYAARGRDISLLARSDQDAVLDLPPFEKVVDKASFAGPETFICLRRDRPERGGMPLKRKKMCEDCPRGRY